MIKSLFYLLIFSALLVGSTFVYAADTNTVSSTVVTDKAPPTANAPSVVVNNSDVCKSAFSVAGQASFVGIATGITITDENCERIKLSRSLYGMGMKVAAVSMLCQDARIFDAMLMAGTPCPYRGKIGTEAFALWTANPQDVPKDSVIFVIKKEKINNTTESNQIDQSQDWVHEEGD